MTKYKVERLAEQVHKAYCDNYEKRTGEPYWTEGDYSKLDEESKEIDRVTALAVVKALRKEDIITIIIGLVGAMVGFLITKYFII